VQHGTIIESSMVIGTVTPSRWAVTFGAVKRGLAVAILPIKGQYTDFIFSVI